jgi:hypothetical protein
MTNTQFIAWLRGLAAAIEKQEDDGRTYELGEWLLITYDTPTEPALPCSTPFNHNEPSPIRNAIKAYYDRKSQR